MQRALPCFALHIALLAGLANVAFSATAIPQGDSRSPLPGRFSGDNITIGLEYALLDHERLVVGAAEAFAQTGLTGMKHFVEAVDWGSMQPEEGAPIDYTKLDWFVGEYQRLGFTELTISLKSHNPWASKSIRKVLGKHVGDNPTPKPEFMDDYERWVRRVVERYDADGRRDMPGLRWPVRYVEIGNEFSSFEPEPVEDYLEMLEHAYAAAHRASDTVQVAHVAFLITPVNMDVARPEEYDERWRTTPRQDDHHGLADMRAILDHPEIFDVLNFHNLGDPYEIEDVMRWLDWETTQRGYRKEVIISDTIATSYAGWGAATRTHGKNLAVLARPATEADRSRLAEYFTKLVEKDAATLAWTRGFVAADHVQRAIIAAEQGLQLINLAFIADIPHATAKWFQAGAGISAWSGAVRLNPFLGTVVERYPPYYAVQQMMGHIHGYRSITRMPVSDDQIRIYEIQHASRKLWVAWRNPKRALLPVDGQPSVKTRIQTGAPRVTIEATITELGQTKPTKRSQPTKKGVVRVALTHTPIWIVPEN